MNTIPLHSFVNHLTNFHKRIYSIWLSENKVCVNSLATYKLYINSFNFLEFSQRGIDFSTSSLQKSKSRHFACKLKSNITQNLYFSARYGDDENICVKSGPFTAMLGKLKQRYTFFNLISYFFLYIYNKKQKHEKL